MYPDQIRKLVRVEITETIRKELYALRDRHEIVFPHFAWGPITICGISFYMVDALPDPGWRVIGIPD